LGIAYADERLTAPMLAGGGLIVLANLAAAWPARPAAA
jgi:hypothetical protein